MTIRVRPFGDRDRNAYARAEGYRELHTRSARENIGIVALNDSLGYVIVDSWGGYTLDLTGRPDPSP